MSEHKTGQSNWTAEQRKLYWERRNQGLRGQQGYVNVHRVVKDEQDKEQRVPVEYTKQFLSSRLQGRGGSKVGSDPSFTKKSAARGKQRLAARSQGRGE